jgi:signal peptidase
MSQSPNATVRRVSAILTIGLIAMLVVVTAAGLRFERRGGSVLSVQTASMVPTFRPGDAIIAERVAPRLLRVGDIVSYRSRLDPNVIVSHRIRALQAGQVITGGDALDRNDPPISYNAIIGRVSAVAPGLGQWLNRLKTPIGLALTIYLPALIILIDQARRLVSYYRPGAYRLYAG